MSSGIALLPIGPGHRPQPRAVNNGGDPRPRTAPSNGALPPNPSAHSARPSSSNTVAIGLGPLRPHLPKINIDHHHQRATRSSSSRRTSGNLALQARDSLAVRKRTLSAGAMSARQARQLARKASAVAAGVDNQAKMENNYNNKNKDASPSPSPPARSRPASSYSGSRPSTAQPDPPHPDRGRSDSHSHSHSPPRSHQRRSQSPPTPSSSSSAPNTPANTTEPAAPSSYHTRAQTHVPQNSHGTTTSAYPATSSQSSRSTTPASERSRTPSPLPSSPAAAVAATKPPPSPPISPRTPLLDLDPDDVNARLRLLVNNNYFLPPAHVKPDLHPIYLSPSTVKAPGGASALRPLSPGTIKDFFRVGKKKSDKKPTTPDALRPSVRAVVCPTGLPQPINSAPATVRDQDYFDLGIQDAPSRNRVVVVRETVTDLPLPPVLAATTPPHTPFRSSSFPTRSRHAKRNSIVDAAMFVDPTTQYDVPPPTHYPSYQQLGINISGMNGNSQLDQFAPPGSPWSPTPSAGASRAMESQDKVWRRAILEQAVDLSLSTSVSDVLLAEGGVRDERVDENETQSSPRSHKSQAQAHAHARSQTQGQSQSEATLEMTFAPRPSFSSDLEPSTSGAHSAAAPGSGGSLKAKKSGGWWSSSSKKTEESLKDSNAAAKSSASSGSGASIGGGSAKGVIEILRDLDPALSPPPQSSSTSMSTSHRAAVKAKQLNIGQAILPNLSERLADLDNNVINISRKSQGQGLQRAPPPSAPPLPTVLQIPPAFSPSQLSMSAPNTPLSLYAVGGRSASPVIMTPLSPRPQRRRPPVSACEQPASKPGPGPGMNSVSSPDVRQSFPPGHSTIKKSLSSPLLSDTHEAGVVAVEQLVEYKLERANNNDYGTRARAGDVVGGDEPSHPYPHPRPHPRLSLRSDKAESVTSVEGPGGAPSLVLHRPPGYQARSRNASSSNLGAESFVTATQSEQYDDGVSVLSADREDYPRFGYGYNPYGFGYVGPYYDDRDGERWSVSRQSSHFESSRPSFDSHHRPHSRSRQTGNGGGGGNAHRNPRASSTFGFRHPNVSLMGGVDEMGSVGGGGGGGGRGMEVEVDITGDPMDHLTMLERRSVSEEGEGEDENESQSGGYASAMDRTFLSQETLSSERISSGHSSLYETGRDGEEPTTTVVVPPLPSMKNKPSAASLGAGLNRPPRGSSEDVAAAPISFFDSVQHQTYIDSTAHDDIDEEEEEEEEEEEDDGASSSTSSSISISEPDHLHHDDGDDTRVGHEPLVHATMISPTMTIPHPARPARSIESHQSPSSSAHGHGHGHGGARIPTVMAPHIPTNATIVGRTSMHTTRPTMPNVSPMNTLATRFPNASQPALVHKKPLANVPVRPSTGGGGGLLAQLKSNKAVGVGVGGGVGGSGGSGGVAGFGIRKRAHVQQGTGVSPFIGFGAGIASSSYSSDAGSVHGSERGVPPIPPIPTAAAVSPISERDQSFASSVSSLSMVTEEERKKLDGLVIQHLEEEKDRLRKIASAMREKRGVDRFPK